MDTQGTVTNPALGEVNERLAGPEQLIVRRTAQLNEIAARFERLERRIERLSAPLPVHAARSVRNGLLTLLK